MDLLAGPVSRVMEWCDELKRYERMLMPMEPVFIIVSD